MATTVEILMKLLGTEAMRGELNRLKGDFAGLGNAASGAGGGAGWISKFASVGTALVMVREIAEVFREIEQIGEKGLISEEGLANVRLFKSEWGDLAKAASMFKNDTIAAFTYLPNLAVYLKDAAVTGSFSDASKIRAEKLAQLGDERGAPERKKADEEKRKQALKDEQEATKKLAEESKKLADAQAAHLRDMVELAKLVEAGGQIGESPGQRADRLRSQAGDIRTAAGGMSPAEATKAQIRAQEMENQAKQIELELGSRAAAVGREQERSSRAMLTTREKLLRIEEDIAQLQEENSAADIGTNAGFEKAVENAQRILELQRERTAIQREEALRGADRDDFSGQIGQQVDQLFRSWGTMAEQTGQLIAGTLGVAVDSIGYSLTNVIMGTQTLKQGFVSVAQTISTQVIQSIIKMFTTWIAQRAVAAVKNMFFSTQEGAADAAAKAPGAALTSISSFGVAAAVGIAALTAAMAAFGGFAGGGYTGDMGRGRVAGVVHGQEYVLPADFVAAVGRTNLDRAVYGGSYVAAAGGSASAVGAFGGGAGRMAVGFFDDRASLRSFLRTHEGKQVLVQALNDARGDLFL
jgi:hypothetical protein